MATPMKTILAALKLVDVKKENLRKAFEDVQSHSLSLSSFSLSWPDLDSHFTSIQSSLALRFHRLQTLVPESRLSFEPIKGDSKSNARVMDSGTGLKDLKGCCERMDGIGLREHMMSRANKNGKQVADALKHAPNAAELVLDSIEGIKFANLGSGNKKDKAKNVAVNGKFYVDLLEGLREVVKSDDISGEVKERAKRLAVEWKGMLSKDGEFSFEALGILHLVGTFGLVNEYDQVGLVELVVHSAKFRRATGFCRELGLVDKVPDIIQRLIATGKPNLAAKFIFEFKLTDKFPPVPILKAHIENAKKDARKIRKNGKRSLQSHNEAVDKEVGALKSVLRIIKEHNLESEYPTETIEKRIEAVVRQRRDAKRPAAFQGNQTRNKRLATKPSDTLATGVLHSDAFVNSTGPFQPSQTAGLLLDQPDPYLVTSARAYGLGADPYVGSSIGSRLYGIPSSSITYSSESHKPPAYYSMPTAYGGHSLPPEYNPGYYPPR